VQQNEDSTALEASYALAVMSEMELEMVESLVMSTAKGFALHTEHENWMMAQVMALPEEAQAKYHHGEEKHHDENMEKMQEFGYFVI